MKILVIDDTEANHQSARETLSGHDVTVVTNANASRLLGGVNHEMKDYDVVLTDLNMPSGRDESEMGAFGYPIALSALMCPRVKYVGLFSNGGAHGDLLSSCNFGNYEVHNIGEKKFLAIDFPPQIKSMYHTNGGKNWGRLLEILTKYSAGDSIRW